MKTTHFTRTLSLLLAFVLLFALAAAGCGSTASAQSIPPEDKGTQAIKLQSEQLHNGGANAGIAKEEEEERLSVLIDHLKEVFGTEWEDADKIIKACADKICEDEDFVAKARTNTMGDLRAIFGGVMMDALAAILSDSQDMFEKFSENPDAFMRVMDDELLPIVYRRCNADVQ